MGAKGEVISISKHRDPARLRAGSLSIVVQAGIIVGMPRPDPPAELVDYLVRSCSMNPAEAVRVIADVLGYYSEAPEAYVRRRHRELKARGLTNDQVFEQISAEMPLRRYAPPDFSLRQLRRIVYG